MPTEIHNVHVQWMKNELYHMTLDHFLLPQKFLCLELNVGTSQCYFHDLNLHYIWCWSLHLYKQHLLVSPEFTVAQAKSLIFFYALTQDLTFLASSLKVAGRRAGHTCNPIYICGSRVALRFDMWFYSNGPKFRIFKSKDWLRYITATVREQQFSFIAK